LLIDWFNKKHSYNIIKLPLDFSPISNNAWLAGFIDADGNFYIRYNKTIQCRFSLEQRKIYPNIKNENIESSYKEIINKICIYFNVNIYIRNKKNNSS